MVGTVSVKVKASPPSGPAGTQFTVTVDHRGRSVPVRLLHPEEQPRRDLADLDEGGHDQERDLRLDWPADGDLFVPIPAAQHFHGSEEPLLPAKSITVTRLRRIATRLSDAMSHLHAPPHASRICFDMPGRGRPMRRHLTAGSRRTHRSLASRAFGTCLARQSRGL